MQYYVMPCEGDVVDNWRNQGLVPAVNDTQTVVPGDWIVFIVKGKSGPSFRHIGQVHACSVHKDKSLGVAFYCSCPVLTRSVLEQERDQSLWEPNRLHSISAREFSSVAKHMLLDTGS